MSSTKCWLLQRRSPEYLFPYLSVHLPTYISPSLSSREAAQRDLSLSLPLSLSLSLTEKLRALRHKILFYFEAFLCGRINHSFIAPFPALPTWLQYYCNTIARYSNPLRPPVIMPYTIQYCALQHRVKAKLRPDRLRLARDAWVRTKETSTETKKQSLNTGARAKHTLHKCLGYPIGEPAGQNDLHTWLPTCLSTYPPISLSIYLSG